MLHLAKILALGLPLVSALKFDVPTNPYSNAVTDINWINGPSDPPSWTLFLMNVSASFQLHANLGYDIDPKPQTLRYKFPVLRPSNDYILYGVNTSNLDQVLGSSPRFSIYA